MAFSAFLSKLRAMAQETKKTKADGIAVAEIEALQERIAAQQLAPEDWVRLGKLLSSFLSLVQMLEHPKLKLRQIRQQLFGQREEPPVPPRPPATPPEASAPGEVSSAEAEPPAPPSEKESEAKAAAQDAAAQKRKGHGRRGAGEYAGAEVVTCLHPELAVGAACPCGGKLFEPKRWVEWIKWLGHPPLTAKLYRQQVLRCSGCQERYTAELPAGVTPQKFDETADVALVLNKIGLQTPWTRLAGMQQLCHLPLPATTQWERCELVADAWLPVWRELEKAAAQAELIGADDTGVTILSHLKAQKLLPKKEQRATHTTGVVAENQSHKMVLLYHGAQHAGEVMSKLLKLRASNLPKPIQIGDASACNWDHEHEVIKAKCWAHAGRGFKELAASFPAEVKFVRDRMAELYTTDRQARKSKLSPEARLLLHQAESVPVLAELKSWRARQFTEKLVEPNSALGKEIQYLENHWHELTEFTRTAGVPLDNNATESALRRPVLLRNNSLFFKTEHGANVSGLLMSILATCQANAVNAWEYLLSAYRNARAVREKPEDWLPWRWAELQGQPSG